MRTHKKINVALIFVGSHAKKNIIPALMSSPNFSISGLYFRTLNKKLISKYKMLNIYSDYENPLKDKNVDCIYVSSSNNDHFKYSLAALKNNKHVICEKPLATNFADVIKLTKMSLKVKKYIFEPFMFEYHQQFIKIKKIIKNKNNEKIFSLTSRFGYPHLKKNNIRYQKNLGGGSFFDCACYPIRATYLLLGGKYLSVNGIINRDSNYDIDTGGSCLINFKSGQSAYLDWGIGRCYSNDIDIWTDKFRVKANFFFSKPDSLNSKIIKVNSKGNFKLIKVRKMNHFSAMFDSFYKIINKKYNKNYLYSIKSYQKFYFTIYKSLLSQR